MDTCPNCGNALRAGAKFCTNCGMRMNEAPSDPNPWKPKAPDVAPSYSTWSATQEQSSSSLGWDTSWKNDAPVEEQGLDVSPAARFEEAINRWKDDAPTSSASVTESPDSGTTSSVNESTATFRTSGTSRNWDFGYGDQSAPHAPADTSASRPVTDSAPASEETIAFPAGDSTIPETTWQSTDAQASAPELASADVPAEPISDAPISDTSFQTSSAPTDESVLQSAPDVAGFHEGGTNEVDYLSGDENIDVDGPQPVNIAITEPPAGETTEPRERALNLIAELQGIVANLNDQPERDETGARILLAGGRARLGDYTSLQQVIDAVREDPRDIDALRDLASTVDMIESLIKERDRLAQTIDDALESLG